MRPLKAQIEGRLDKTQHALSNRCPKCGGRAKVVDCRASYGGTRRRYVCGCGFKYASTERILPTNVRSRYHVPVVEFDKASRFKRDYVRPKRQTKPTPSTKPTTPDLAAWKARMDAKLDTL